MKAISRARWFDEFEMHGTDLLRCESYRLDPKIAGMTAAAAVR